MFHGLIRLNGLMAACLAVGIGAALPSIGNAVEVKIVNSTNETIFVATAHAAGVGLNCEGWHPVKPRDTLTCRAKDADQLYLSIEVKGKEKTFPSHKTIRTYAALATKERFVVTDYANGGYLMLWGDNLENSHIVKKDGKSPVGWEDRRFFEVGTKNITLDVKP